MNVREKEKWKRGRGFFPPLTLFRYRLLGIWSLLCELSHPIRVNGCVPSWETFARQLLTLVTGQAGHLLRAGDFLLSIVRDATAVTDHEKERAKRLTYD